MSCIFVLLCFSRMSQFRPISGKEFRDLKINRLVMEFKTTQSLSLEQHSVTCWPHEQGNVFGHHAGSAALNPRGAPPPPWQPALLHLLSLTQWRSVKIGLHIDWVEVQKQSKLSRWYFYKVSLSHVFGIFNISPLNNNRWGCFCHLASSWSFSATDLFLFVSLSC